MPLPERQRLAEYRTKGAHLALRLAAIAPEQRRARRLARQHTPPNGVQGAGKRVLVLTPRDWSAQVAWESMIGHALRLRGAHVSYVTCGGGLEICDRTNTWEAPPMPCQSCNSYVQRTLSAHGFEPHPLRAGWDGPGDPGEWPELDGIPFRELSRIRDNGLSLGELTDIPVKWFLMSASLEADPLAPITWRRFLRSARRVAKGIADRLDELQPDVVLILNGLFFFESIASELCRQRGIDVVTYERGFRPGTLVFRRSVAACLMDLSPIWNEVGERPLEEDEQQRIDDFLRERGVPSPTTTCEGPGHIRSHRRVVLFTNLTWDSAVIGQGRAFHSLRDWLATTLKIFQERPSDELVIRIHPAETSLPGKQTREPLSEYIYATFGSPLPPNVRLVPPDSDESSYSLMSWCDIGLVFTSTTGLELAAAGKPVIVAGTTHYANKGFTIDAESEAHYRDLLIGVLDGAAPGPPNVRRARAYAYYLFLGVPIGPLGVSEPVPGIAELNVRDLAELAPGRDSGFDLVCEGILHGGSFLPQPRPRGRS